jgi:hypothetical protein
VEFPTARLGDLDDYRTYMSLGCLGGLGKYKLGRYDHSIRMEHHGINCYVRVESQPIKMDGANLYRVSLTHLCKSHLPPCEFAERSVLANIMSNPKALNTIDDDIMTAEELAMLLRCHVVTIRLDAAAGKLPGRQVGNR